MDRPIIEIRGHSVCKKLLVDIALIVTMMPIPTLWGAVRDARIHRSRCVCEIREHWNERWIVDIFRFDWAGISAIMLLGPADFGDV